MVPGTLGSRHPIGPNEATRELVEVRGTTFGLQAAQTTAISVSASRPRQGTVMPLMRMALMDPFIAQETETGTGTGTGRPAAEPICLAPTSDVTGGGSEVGMVRRRAPRHLFGHAQGRDARSSSVPTRKQQEDRLRPWP